MKHITEIGTDARMLYRRQRMVRVRELKGQGLRPAETLTILNDEGHNVKIGTVYQDYARVNRELKGQAE